jgi:NAD(P)-dependent dehydrogenase (short-subunit alcohol dehydrogenase family)
LHSAATLGTLTPLALYDLETWQKVMQVNFNAAYLLTRACLGALEQSPQASVIFTTSEVARHGRAYWGAYAAAGAALENLVQVWADELSANTRIRMNSLDPGAVRSALRARAYPGENPLTLPAPEAVMPQYLYLMGPDSHAITGQALRA